MTVTEHLDFSTIIYIPNVDWYKVHKCTKGTLYKVNVIVSDIMDLHCVTT